MPEGLFLGALIVQTINLSILNEKDDCKRRDCGFDFHLERIHFLRSTYLVRKRKEENGVSEL